MGEDNQLEFALGSSHATAVAPPAATPIKPRADSALFPEAFARFAETADAIGRNERKSEKVTTLTHYLGSLSTEAAGIAALYFTARTFPQSDQRVLRAGWALPAAPSPAAWAPPPEPVRTQDELEFSWAGETARHVCGFGLSIG